MQEILVTGHIQKTKNVRYEIVKNIQIGISPRNSVIYLNKALETDFCQIKNISKAF